MKHKGGGQDDLALMVYAQSQGHQNNHEDMGYAFVKIH